MNFLRTRLVSFEEWQVAHRKTGSVYFIRDNDSDKVKIGHSFDPIARLGQLQVGNGNRLKLIGIIAAPIAVEPRLHFQFYEGRCGGEWFYDRGIVSQWLMDMTQGEPVFRQIWEFVRGREFFGTWDENTGTLTKHYFNDETGEWEPPFK